MIGTNYVSIKKLVNIFYSNFRPCILIFDSLRSGCRSKIVTTLRDYLECEYREKIGKDRVFSKETFRGCCPSVPQQPNFSDCGIYVLQYVESFFKVRPILFNRQFLRLFWLH